jgi:hypothetical protein
LGLARLELGLGGLGNPHPTGQLPARHAEGVSDCPDPAPMGSRLIEQGPEPIEPPVELSSGLGLRGRHRPYATG